MSENPTPSDVFAHVFAHDLRPVAGGADALEHFQSATLSVPEENFQGSIPIGSVYEGSYYYGSWTSYVRAWEADRRKRKPSKVFAEAPRCFVGQAIIVAEKPYDGQFNGTDDVRWTAEYYGVPLYLVGYIYSGVVNMMFAQAREFLLDVIEAERSLVRYPLPSRYSNDENEIDDENDRAAAYHLDDDYEARFATFIGQ